MLLLYYNTPSMTEANTLLEHGLIDQYVCDQINEHLINAYRNDHRKKMVESLILICYKGPWFKRTNHPTSTNYASMFADCSMGHFGTIITDWRDRYFIDLIRLESRQNMLESIYGNIIPQG
jgi:hypothetical protein